MTDVAADVHLHAFTIAAMDRALANLAPILAKAEVHARAHDVDEAVLLGSRLHANMFSLIQQLQYALYLPMDFARHAGDAPPPKVGYDETDFNDVKKAIEAARTYLGSIAPGRLAERAETVVPIFMDDTKGMLLAAYAAKIIMPDFYFHLSIAYAILRHNGVPLGKDDFLGRYETSSLG